MTGCHRASEASPKSQESLAGLCQENQRLQQENAELKVSLQAATERCEALTGELRAINRNLVAEREKFTAAESSAHALIETISRQKSDLEVLVQTLTEHGDSLDAQWHQKFREASLQAGIDGLTQIPNRRQFDAYLQQQWEHMLRERAPLALLMLDVDAFKTYNDTYGHPAGDTCLRQIAIAISQCLQHPEDFAARYGGEEFVAVMPRTDLASAVLVARRIQEAIRRLQIPHENSPVSPLVTVSIGAVSLAPRPSLAPECAIQIADRRLYQAKQKGRNRIVDRDCPDSIGPDAIGTD